MSEPWFILGVDLDGVCGDHTSAFRRVVAAERGIDPARLPEQTSWSFKEWGLDDDDFLAVHRRAVLEHRMFRDMPVIEGAADALWRLSDAGVWIRLITHRLYANWGHATAVADTVAWLDAANIPYRDLCFLGNKPQVEAHVYVDDAPHNVAQLRALSGYGAVANDVLGTADPFYDKTIAQRPRDLARARKLLAEAKFDLGRRYPLHTIDETFGEVESAKLFASQVGEIGVQVDVVVQEAGVFYEKTWCKAPLYTMYWGTNDSVAFFAQKVMVSTSETNETGWQNREFDAAYGRLLAATDRSAQEQASRQMQKIVHEDSGYLLWGMGDGVEVATTAVHGLPTSPGFGWVLLDRVWLAG